MVLEEVEGWLTMVLMSMLRRGEIMGSRAPSWFRLDPVDEIHCENFNLK